jgi:hypothetical protein
VRCIFALERRGSREGRRAGQGKEEGSKSRYGRLGAVRKRHPPWMEGHPRMEKVESGGAP